MESAVALLHVGSGSSGLYRFHVIDVIEFPGHGGGWVRMGPAFLEVVLPPDIAAARRANHHRLRTAL